MIFHGPHISSQQIDMEYIMNLPITRQVICICHLTISIDNEPQNIGDNPLDLSSSNHVRLGVTFKNTLCCVEHS